MKISFRVPAGRNERFAVSVAQGLIGATTLFEGVKVPIIDAFVPADGTYLDLTIDLPGETLPWPFNERIV